MKEEILALLKRFEDAVLVDKTDCFCAVFLSTLMIVWKAICSKGSTSRQGSLPSLFQFALFTKSIITRINLTEVLEVFCPFRGDRLLFCSVALTRPITTETSQKKISVQY